MKRILYNAAALLTGAVMLAAPAIAAPVADAAATAAATVPDAAPAVFTPTAEMVNKGDTAWMLTATSSGANPAPALHPRWPG